MVLPLDDRLRRAFERPPTFSFVHFDGDVQNYILSLLERCGYRPISKTYFRAPFQDAFTALEKVEGPGNTIVKKGCYPVAGGTVLLDPEMIIGVSHAPQLEQFCKQQSVHATVVFWERVSESISHTVIGPEGIESKTFLFRGKPEGEQVKPSTVLLRDPTPKGLIQILAAAGIPVGQVFGDIDVWAFKLDESAS